MEFNAKWITTKEFAPLKPINVWHRELDGKVIERSPKELDASHFYFRKEFEVDAVGKYSIKISADDYYKLYVNGQFVCQGPANNYHDRYYYNVADITSYIKEGKNVIGVHVYYHGPIARSFNSGDNRQGMIAEVLCNDKLLFGTDSSWKYSRAYEYIRSHSVGYETQYMEDIDFNKAQPGWNTPDFDDKCFVNAIEKADDDHSFIGEAELVDTYIIKPQLVKKLGAGHYFVDFGKEYTGQIHLVFNGVKGQKVTIRCGEETIEGDDTCVRYQMRCNCDYENILTLSGERDDLLFFDYIAFRYAEIITEADNIDADSIDMFVRHHKFDRSASSFKSNNELLNNIWEICTQALTISVQEAYMDCPSREKGQYLGDYCVSGLAHLYLTGDVKLFKKALLEFADSARISKGLMCVVPGSFMQELADYSFLYPYAAIKYIEYTGDTETVKPLIPIIDDMMKYFEGFAREDGLLEGLMEITTLVDWPPNLRDDYAFDATEPPTDPGLHNVINGYYLVGIKDIITLREMLGMDTSEYKALFEKVSKSFINTFFDKKQGLFTDTKESAHAALHSNVLPLLSGIVPEDAVQNVKDFIVNKGLCCGVWFSCFVLRALASIGAYEEAFALITSKGEHSWYNMISEGATTCYEAWGKEQKWNTSLCHPWASSPIIVMIENFLGIKPSSFATGKLDMSPNMPKGLSVDITLPTSKDKKLQISL
ncbi:MAG: alpha-L-rhamnosidase [Ruminococcaceae bacterium]|nr:alpha-L-rhamnosidase [Oscillospiraceae bacterium]